ncbi:hypothetical protein [Nocardia iowensis]|uniref:Uncharacterized protein n=1 Tax=Nocardia iowensis TaxID=204891 RepID=A0ABX8S1V1_NOCIO|nr:hypothetical protein [Nocardia iowensis]QXN94560.1 hypothetical protein KV110_16810 [Nocardia iowensis]
MVSFPQKTWWEKQISFGVAFTCHGTLDSEIFSGCVMEVVDRPEDSTGPIKVVLPTAGNLPISDPNDMACSGIQFVCSLDNVIAAEQHHALECSIACPDCLLHL